MGKRHFICLITDRHRLSPDAPDPPDPPDNNTGVLENLATFVAAAARAGVDLIQLRERDLDARTLTTMARRSVVETAGTHARILVNDRMDVAVAAGAHGVHLRSDSIAAAAVRRAVPAEFVVGRSVHSYREAVDAARSAGAGGLDYLIFGTMFPSASKSAGHRLTGLDELERASAEVSIPILAVGGMTLERAEEAGRRGAAGIAAIGLFIPPPGVDLDGHLERVVGNLRRVFDTCGAVP
jgi:thiamine-phosphate diphosphorylase